MSEKTAWAVFRENIIRPTDRIDRIENYVGAGFPDANCCIEGVEFWLEFKAPEEPKRKTTPLFGSNHKLSVEQRNWILRQLQARGRAYIYIETDMRRLLMHGKWCDEINQMTVPDLIANSLWHVRRPTKQAEWRQLRETLHLGK